MHVIKASKQNRGLENEKLSCATPSQLGHFRCHTWEGNGFDSSGYVNFVK